MKDITAKRLSTLHTALLKLTRGKLGKRLADNDMLLLTTVGSKTGKIHTVPLLYLRDDEDIIIIASWGGRPSNPQWYGNLVAEPNVQVQVLGEVIQVVARTATTAERTRLWPMIEAAYDGYTEYQSRTDRQIPAVILTRV